ncbi:unnamed protein product [Calypogeia fissa]
MMGGGNITHEDGKHGIEMVEASHRPSPPLSQPAEPAHIGREPISACLGIDYAFPPHLEYAYPPPDGNILTNIVNALIAVPRFYTQVLHLMNKMNLPAPFRPALPTPPLPRAPAQSVPKRQAGDLSSGESELEFSDEEDETDPNDFDRKLREVGKPGRRDTQAKKRAKREAIIGPAVDKGASHEAAGVKAIVIPKAPTAIKKNAPVFQIKIAPRASSSDRKGKLEEATQAPEAHQQPPTASREDLEGGRLETSDMLSLPILKNYAPGNPTRVLYIKNLAKDVTLDDMYYIFGAFFPNRTTAVEQLNVKVMQEGRMRGQAFVCLPTTELAMVALAGTHGFVFKGKPMVVQYGHNEGGAKTFGLRGHERA